MPVQCLGDNVDLELPLLDPQIKERNQNVMVSQIRSARLTLDAVHAVAGAFLDQRTKLLNHK